MSVQSKFDLTNDLKMVNKLCLETDRESFFVIPIILLQLLIFSQDVCWSQVCYLKTVLSVSVMSIVELGYVKS